MEIQNDRELKEGIDINCNVNILHGHVLNSRDLVEFENKTVEEIKQVFKDSVGSYDDYLEVCAELENIHNNAFWGSLILQTSQDNCQIIQLAATKSDKTTNEWMEEVLIHTATNLLP